MSCSFSYKGTTGIKVKWLVFNAVLSFCCCSSPGSYQSSLNGPSRLSQGLATRDALRPGYAAVLSSSQQHLASMYLFATVLINCSFSQVLHEVLTGLRLCLVSLALSYLQCKKESEVAQSCLTLCDPMDCSPPGSSVHGIFQARVLECVAISFSRGSPQPRDRTQVSHIMGRCFTIWATREAQNYNYYCL